MPQVDLDTLVSVCAGGSCDRKIACETLAGDDKQPPGDTVLQDFPPESFWLSKDAELDWFDRNAILERKESTKGISNHSTATTTNPNSNSSSQRFSMNLKSKASIIGLPKPQKTCFADAKLRRNLRPANIQLFPKRPQPSNKTTVPFSEPSSPKVSCMGRVRSKRDRSRRLRNNSQRSSKPAAVKPKGLWSSLRSVFQTRCRHEPRVELNKSLNESASKTRVPKIKESHSSPRKSTSAGAYDGSYMKSAAEAPGLGGMKHFASGRRSSSCSIDEMLSVNVTKSEPSVHTVEGR